MSLFLLINSDEILNTLPLSGTITQNTITAKVKLTVQRIKGVVSILSTSGKVRSYNIAGIVNTNNLSGITNKK